METAKVGKKTKKQGSFCLLQMTVNVQKVGQKQVY